MNASQRAALEDERAELIAANEANEAATSWGAANGARSARIDGIDRALAVNVKESSDE
jgi:hypothetical protein